MRFFGIFFTISGCIAVLVCHYLVFRHSKLFRLFMQNPAKPVSGHPQWFSAGRLYLGFIEWFHFFIIAIDDEYLHLSFYSPLRLYLRPCKASIPLDHLKLQPAVPMSGNRAHLLDTNSGLDFMVFGAPGKALQFKLSAP